MSNAGGRGSPAGPPKTNNKGSITNPKGHVVSVYAQRFAAAVHALIADGPIKQRLVSAYSEHLADLAETDLPPAIQHDFGALHAAVTRVNPVGNESRVRASVQKMSSAEATGHAATILRLYVVLLGHAERAEPLKVVPAPRKTPRYLTGR
jgi:hypothetical protein